MKILNGPFLLCCHEQMKKHLEAPSRSMLAVQPKREKGDYFVHRCVKILAKRKRGNKFPLHGKQGGRQFKAREKQEREAR